MQAQERQVSAGVVRALGRVLSALTPRERRHYWFLVAGKSLVGILDLAGIGLVGIVAASAASLANPSQAVTVMGLVLPHLSAQELFLALVAILVLFVGKSLLSIAFSRSVANFVANVEVRNTRVIVDEVLHRSLDELEVLSKGDVQWGVIGSTTAAFTGLLSRVSVFVAEGFLLLLVLGLFVVVDPVASLFAALYFGVVIGGLQMLLSRALARAGTDISEGSVESSSAISDAFGALREISVFQVQSFFSDRVVSARSRLSAGSAKASYLLGMPRYIVETALIAGVVVFAGVEFSTGDLAQALVVVGVFLTGGLRIMASLLPLQHALGQTKNESGQAEMSLSLIESQTRSFRSKPHEVITQPELRSLGSVVELTGVSYTYPTGQEPAIKEVSLGIPSGSRAAFIGPSGSGKSTLADIILGLLAPQDGRVQIDGLSPANIELSSPGMIGYVPQRPGIVAGSIAENVAFGIAPERIDRQRVREVLRLAHLGELSENLHGGIDAPIGERGASLSGGQIQRLGIARALYGRPRLLVLDEATSALDAHAEGVVTETLAELGPEVTILVIAHRLSTVQNADRVHLVQAGRITHSGTFSELRKEVPMVEEYVKLLGVDPD
jgi:ABC-type multidrug transport system fused ATPase/permease subunit